MKEANVIDVELKLKEEAKEAEHFFSHIEAVFLSNRKKYLQQRKLEGVFGLFLVFALGLLDYMLFEGSKGYIYYATIIGVIALAFLNKSMKKFFEAFISSLDFEENPEKKLIIVENWMKNRVDKEVLEKYFPRYLEEEIEKGTFKLERIEGFRQEMQNNPYYQEFFMRKLKELNTFSREERKLRTLFFFKF